MCATKWMELEINAVKENKQDTERQILHVDNENIM